MSHFFLHNQAIDISNYENFKKGINNLIGIEKLPAHRFWRSNSCYELKIFVNHLFPNCHLPEGRAFLEFFEKLSPCEEKVECENSATQFCKSDKNGFLGIDFSGIQISQHKKITDSITYQNWITYYQSNSDKLAILLVNIKVSAKFQKEFETLAREVQESIIEKFKEAIERDFIRFPDKKIIKDVSNSNKCTVLELRVYAPVALRVYFNLIDGTFFIASLEQKNNPDQNADIKKAEKLLILISGQ